MKLKILYRKNLKMSPGKLAAQSVHAALGLSKRADVDPNCSVIVLEASDKKFFTALEDLTRDGHDFYTVKDAGYTEVAPGTATCLAFLEEE